MNDANGGTYNSNTITVTDWANSLEANGAVFLPAYVWRVGTSIYTYYLGEEGYYWASDIGNNNYPRYVWFSYGELYTHNAYQRNLGHSVRLVRPAQNGLFVVNVIANPAVGGEVSEGGVYPEGALCTFTASANEGYTFVNWTANGEVVSTETSFSCTITSGKTFVANFRNDYVNITDGVLGGHFSVSENRQVGFSQGNLQYIGSVGNGDENNTGAYWKFAEHQWDYLGNNGQGSDSRMANRDLFGWGTSGYNHGAVRYQPWSAGGNYEDYCVYGDPAFNLFDQTGQADWGYNAIANGGNQENSGWRTLKREEWDYLINTRTTVSGIRWVKGTVNGVNGVILLPDTWLSSYYALNDANGGSYDSNTITADDWANSLEANGAVFLPAGGAYENYIYGAGFGGAYWSSSEYSNEYSYAISFYDNNLDANWDPFRKNGLSVRLVRPTQNGIFGINAVPNPLEAGEVIGSGAYPEGAVCSLTASANEGYTFVNWTWNGEVLSTEATYSFTVTGGKTLVANFHYIDVENSDGALAGHFSVSEGRQVFFSQGNLQYIGSAGNGDENNTGAYWKFAEHQWDYLGNNGQGSDSRMANRDLFGWGTSGYNQGAVCYQPWSVNTYSYDYLPFGSDICGLFGQTGQAEWGYNPIINGGNQENDGWRTLTNEEWNYLINTRETESGIRWTRAKVNGVNGMILLPDTWSLSYYTLNDANGGSYGSNIITATDWFAALEANGAIFLPAAGYRSGTSVGSVGSYGYYWSASPWEEYGYYIHCIYYNGNYLDTYNAYVRSYGQSVRLVRSAQNNSYSISAISDPLEGGAISGEGTYLDGFHCTLTATANEGFAFANWTENGEVVSSDATYGFTVTGDRNLEAHFVLPFVVTVSTDPEEGGTVTGEGEYVYGAECTLTAMANEGYAFLNWTENGEVVSSDATYTFTVTEDRDLVANFVDGVIGYTYFDWQTNNGAITRTVVWPDGKVSFGFTTASDGSYSDRGTGIGSYDSANDEWIPSEGRVENEKTGFGSIARYGANGIVVAAHTADECHVFIVPDKDNIPVNAVSAVSCLDNTYVPAWPNVMTSGSNRQIIHVIASASSGTIPGMENVSQPLIYFRSTDGGQTWDKQNIVLPYMGAEYSPFWQANCCYWMETTDDNCLALVVNNEWSDGMVLYSYDDGETWQRKVFYKHPDPFGHFGVPFVDQFFYYPRWTSCQWDSQHHLHVLYEFHTKWGEAGSNSYAPGSGGVAYWNETMPYNSEGTTASAIEGNLVPGQPFVMESAYLYNDIYRSWWHFGYEDAHEMWPEYLGYLAPLTDDGDPEDPYQATGFNIQNTESHGIYNSGVCAFPVLCMVPGTDEMVAVWSALDENHTDANGKYYYKLFASYSNNGGASWSPMVHLTHDAVFNNAEFVYNQAAVVGRKLIIATQTDAETGSYVNNMDYEGSNNYYKGFVFDIDALFDTVTLPEVDQELMLISGWNWISSYVDYRPESLAEMQELIASECESAMVKSQNDGYVSYAEESWTGSLSTMNNAQMYLVLVDHDIPLMFFGPQSNPARHPITLKPGWNWIGYPLTVPMELSEALSGLQPEDGDLIKGSSGYAIYDALEDKWAGNLTTLEPGKGYIYLSVSEENRVFVFPSER